MAIKNQGARLTSKQQSVRIKLDSNLGGQQAESDPLLDDAFFDSAQFRQTLSKDDPNAFLIGRTGSGKSALLARIEAISAEHTIRINPEDLSLTYISHSGAVKSLKAERVHLDPLFIALWKHVLLIEIIRHRYDIDTDQKKQNVLSMLRERFRRDNSKAEALRYLDDFYGKFWQETDMRVREITDAFEQRVATDAGGSSGVAKAALQTDKSRTTTDRQEWADRMQRIVNDTQLPRLNQMIRVLDEDILDSRQNFTFIVIDDLDRDWVDEPLANDLVRCLFRAVIDLKRVKNLKILVALRTNIFEALDFGRTGGQEEKFRALVTRMTWSHSDLESLLDERVSVMSARSDLELSSVRKLLPQKNQRRGDPVSYIFDRTLMRPRDAISFVNECLRESNGKSRISWDAINKAKAHYSQNRLLALRDEWKPTYPGIDRLFQQFEQASSTMYRKELLARLDEVALILADDSFIGTQWLTEMASPIWEPGDHDWVEDYGQLIALLYNIGFIGCFAGNSSEARYSYNDNGFLAQRRNLESVTHFVVHPAFCPALDIDESVAQTQASLSADAR